VNCDRNRLLQARVTPLPVQDFNQPNGQLVRCTRLLDQEFLPGPPSTAVASQISPH